MKKKDSGSRVLALSPAHPAICGLLAHTPTALSQAMHSAGFSYAKLPFVYVRFSTDDTRSAFDAMRSLGLRGFSLTIPHKEEAMKLVDEMSTEASEIGAINTAINDRGRVLGENTDWVGIIEAFAEAGAELRGKRVLVMGAGGACRAALYAVKRRGASAVTLWNRTPERAKAVAKSFGCTVATDFRATGLEAFDIVINATPVADDSGYPFSFDALTSRHAVLDMVTRETPLLEAARKRGGTAIPGIRMLLFQGLKQFELFTGIEAPRQVMEEALMNEYARCG